MKSLECDHTQIVVKIFKALQSVNYHVCVVNVNDAQRVVAF